MEFKYIIVKGPVPDEKHSAIVFPKELSHKDVARIHRADEHDMRLAGAGFCTLNPVKVWGVSESLRGMPSKPEDAYIIKQCYVSEDVPWKPYTMNVETDYDFALKFQGVVYSDHDFVVHFNSIEELDEIEILGGFGTPFKESTKCHEFLEAVDRIKANPNESFSTLGGNRGVAWYINPKPGQ